MVVNGTSESDWEAVAGLARQHSWIIPSFGLHPWHVRGRSPRWQEHLQKYLEEFPSAGIGEIGLDRWIADPDVPAQIEVFRRQLDLARRLNRPASIHCLRAWGLLERELAEARLPECGFLLHSYGGPEEMTPRFAKLGAYFSFSPYFCHERKGRQADVFARLPLKRLLIETDAPDMWPPDHLARHPLRDAAGKSLNHPANLLLSLARLAEIRQLATDALAVQLEQNFLRLFKSAPPAT